MKKQTCFWSTIAVFLTVFMFTVINVQSSFAEDYPGMWYGWHCPVKDLKETKGPYPGDAFPDQKIIGQWGYKSKSVDEIKDLIPQGYYDIVTNPEVWGHIRINETPYIPKDKWPGERIKRMREATEKYKGQPTIDEKGHLRNYTAGIPFPGSENPVEIAWNFIKGRNWGQTLEVNWIVAVADKKGGIRFTDQALFYYAYNGRLFGDHAPKHMPNPNNYEYMNGYAFKYPYDLYGMTLLIYRYDDPDKQDDSWAYIPYFRRVRRMSTAQRWDRLPGGNDLSYDNTTGFDGKPTNYTWKYLGRKELLVGHNSKYEMHMLKDKPGGSAQDLKYQRVNTIVLEYTPKIHAPISRAVMYIDPESFVCYYAENYDKRGRLWLFFNHMWSVDGDGNQTPTGFFLADVQRVHSSCVYVYDIWHDEAAETVRGIIPKNFTMQHLRSKHGAR